MSAVACGTERGYRRHIRSGQIACASCKEAHNRVTAARRLGTLPADDPRHGTMNGYLNCGCRCTACSLVAMEERRARKAAATSASLAAWPERLDRPGEVWKPVVGGESFYEVSNFGRVYSQRLPGRSKSGRFLSPYPRKSGHLSLSLSVNGIRRQVDVHRLVMQAFVGPCPQGLEVRHLDGNPQNNHLSNLQYGTRQENVQDAIRHGTHWPSCLKSGRAAA